MDNNLLPKVFLIESQNEELYIDDDFFVLYKERKLFYYKKIEEKLAIDDLKVFIKNTLGLDDINVLLMKNAKIKNQKNVKYNFFKAIRKPYFVYYVLYLLVLLFIFIFIYMNNNKKIVNDNFDNLQTNMEMIKKNNEFTYITKIILNIYENTKLNNVTVDSILFENSKFLLELESEKKDGIYKLLTVIEKSVIENMQYNEENKKYKAHVSFKISRN